jgi:hypothetical protein
LATPERDSELETRLALADAELRALKDMLAEVRETRDAWQAQAERLALPSPATVAATPRRPWWRRLAG